jgi:hypothetical protein
MPRMPFSGVRISWGDHGEEAALGTVGGVGFPPFPFPVREGFDALFEHVDAAAAAIDPVEGQARAGGRSNARGRARLRVGGIFGRA